MIFSNKKPFFLAVGIFICLFLVFSSYVHKAQSSASLTISSASLASDGKTMTVNVGGVSGSLLPASGVTGFTVKLATVPLQQLSATSTGSVVTINLKNTVFSGQTVTVDLAASPTSNLTDESSNTPQGQTGVSVTNNSTQSGTTISGANANLYFLGQWAQSSGAGHNFKYKVGNNSRLDTNVTGTSCDVMLYGGNSYTITVDGTPTTGTVSGSGFSWVSVFSDLSNTEHTVKIESSFIESDTPLRIVGADSGVSVPAGYSVFLPITSGTFFTYSQLDGSPYVSSTNGGYNTSAYWSSCDGGVRFKAAVSDIWLWGYGFSPSVPLVIYQDGIQIASFTPTANSKWDLWHVASGLDEQSHTYEIISVGSGVDGGLILYGIMLTGGTGLVNEVQSARTIVSWYGDSIVSESSGNLSSSKEGEGWLVTRPLGLASVRKGFSSQRVSTYLRDHTSEITGLATKPKVVFITGGVNDQAAGVAIGDVNTAGTFAGDMKTMISNVAAGIPATSTIFVRAVLPNASINYTNRSLYTAAQQAAVNAYMSGSPTAPAYFISTDNWLTPATDLVDGSVHPNANGYSKITNREIPLVNGIVNGESYTVVGPSSGYSEQTSTNFTISLPGGATFTGDQTVIISDGGDGGTIVPSVGSSGVSSVTVTPTSGLTSFTFTYAPASSGDKSISFTNGQGWTNPATLTYVSIPNNKTLTYTAGANGSLTGSTTQSVVYGSDGTAVTAVPNAGYRFVDWSDSSTANPRTDTNVTDNISVTANFIDDTPPTVTAISPSANNQNVEINTNLSATFSENMATSTISSSSFTLRSSNSGIGATVSYQNKIATLHPSRELECSQDYYATLTTAITDLADNPLSSNYVWHFLTACSSNNSSSSGNSGNSQDNNNQSTPTSNSTNSTSSTQASSTPTTTGQTEATSTQAVDSDQNNNNQNDNPANSIATGSANQNSSGSTDTSTPASIIIDTLDELLPTAITNSALYQRLIGRIVLRVENRGEAYYINPFKPEMYYLGKPEIAIQVIRLLGVGITNANLNKIQTSDSTDTTNIDWSFAQKQAGKIFLQVESHGEAWYVNPLDLRRYYLATPTDALSIMSGLGLGISERNFERLTR